MRMSRPTTIHAKRDEIAAVVMLDGGEDYEEKGLEEMKMICDPGFEIFGSDARRE